jgi:hypothetical protein
MASSTQYQEDKVMGDIIDYLIFVHADSAVDALLSDRDNIPITAYPLPLQARFKTRLILGIIEQETKSIEQMVKRFPSLLSLLSGFHATIDAFHLNDADMYHKELDKLLQQIQWCRERVNMLKQQQNEVADNSEDLSLSISEGRLLTQIEQCLQHITEFMHNFEQQIPPPNLNKFYPDIGSQASTLSRQGDAVQIDTVHREEASVEKKRSKKRKTSSGVDLVDSTYTSEHTQHEEPTEPRPLQTPESNKKGKTNGSSKKSVTISGSKHNSSRQPAAASSSTAVRQFSEEELRDEAQLLGLSQEEWYALTSQTDQEIQQFILKRKKRRESNQNSGENEQLRKKRKLSDKHESATQLKFKPLEADDEQDESKNKKGKERLPREQDIEQFSDVSDNERRIERANKVVAEARIATKTKNKKQGTKKTPWSENEVKHLLDGIRRYGLGNWSTILSKYKFDSVRDSISLRDKYRNMVKAGLIVE